MTEAQTVALVPARTKVELGVAGGFTASVVMAICMMALNSLGILRVAWFSVIGSMLGASGLEAEAALYGLGWYLGFGVIWGVVFAFAFKTYSVEKGVGVAGIWFVITAMALAAVNTPELQGTILTISLTDSFLLLVSLVIGFGFWGATVGYVGKRYLR